MKQFISSLVIGLIFGAGIAISGMIDPAKVINFFDFFGTWDPSLALVIVGAVGTTAIGYRLVFGHFPKPALEPKFFVPTNTVIDTRLISGSAIFGVGWGISGFCPGGSIPALGLGEISAWLFFGAMIIGILLARKISIMWQKKVSA